MLSTTRDYLISKSFSDIYMGSMPSLDNCIGLFSTAGHNPNVSFDGNISEQRGLQVVVRNKSYPTGETIINNIYKLLVKEMTLSVAYIAQQSPFSIGKNENGNSEFSVNFICLKEG